MLKKEKEELDKDEKINIYLDQKNEEEINKKPKDEKEENIIYYSKEFNKIKSDKIFKKIRDKKKHIIKFNKAQNIARITAEGLIDISQNLSNINSNSLLTKNISSTNLINKISLTIKKINIIINQFF